MKSLSHAHVSPTGDAQRRAVDWLVSQLRWERTLDQLRSNEVGESKKAA